MGEAMGTKPQSTHAANSAEPAVLSQNEAVQWSWPAWALDNKSPCIEVYVEDEETREGRWIQECVPLHRVVHPDGYDQFLACEYVWDGEPYELDFEPQHVRPRWTKQTVLELARAGTL